jgi:hypothetical protein
VPGLQRSLQRKNLTIELAHHSAVKTIPKRSEQLSRKQNNQQKIFQQQPHWIRLVENFILAKSTFVHTSAHKKPCRLQG